jgi:Reversibly glycosylated polypeptide
MKIALATTTINEPILLEKYADAAVEFCKDGQNEIFFIVAGDRKTPSSVEKFCKTLTDKKGIDVEYLDPFAQLTIASNESIMTALLRWDCIQRRNIAGYRALQKSADYIIYVDDDNHIFSGNYFEDHLRSLNGSTFDVQSSSNGFFNIMNSAEGSGVSNKTFPRGFPFKLRNENPIQSVSRKSDVKIAANAGLWLEEPDIDASTRISTCPNVERYNIKENESTELGVWTPINSQNTIFRSEFLCGYFLSSEVGRYDDIYAGYVFQKLINHFKYTISFGAPIVIQHRNEHDLLVDLEDELSGMRHVDFVISFLRSLEAVGDTPPEFMNNLLDSWEMALLSLDRSNSAAHDLRKLLLGYRIWNDALARL